MAAPVLGPHHILFISLQALSSEIFCLYKSVSFDKLHASQE